MKVLIVDDSASMRQMLSIVLTGAGHTVVEATDGESGFGKLTDDIDVVITDYNMPGVSGPELIGKIRQGNVNRTVPILVLTTESDREKKEQGRVAGATGWMTKPFQKDALLNALNKITRRVEF